MLLILFYFNLKNTSTLIFLFFLFIGCNTKPDDSSSNLIWSDEFSEENLNLNYWNIIEGNGCPELCGFGNNEVQSYSRNVRNIRVENGNLIIEAQKENNSFYSAKITTANKIDWNTGYIEIRALLPYGKGTWPAIWMLPTLDRKLNWPKDGEIDIMEHVGYNQNIIYGTIHTDAFNHLKNTHKSDSIYVNTSVHYNTYGLNWTKNKLEWYVNDTLFHSVNKKDNALTEEWPFNKNFHLILNLAVGGDWGGKYGIDENIFPQRFLIDYVRLFSKK